MSTEIDCFYLCFASGLIHVPLCYMQASYEAIHSDTEKQILFYLCRQAGDEYSADYLDGTFIFDSNQYLFVLWFTEAEFPGF